MMKKENIQTIRCSSLPRITSCTASLETPCDADGKEIIIDIPSDVSAMGDAAHKIQATIIKENLNDIPEDLFFSVSTEFDIDEKELRFLAWAGLKFWRTVRDRLKVINIEEEMQAEIQRKFILTGHPDLMAVMADDPDTLVVIDWKTGHIEKNYIAQVKGYALLALHTNMNVKTIRVLTVYTRLGTTETQEFSAEEIMAYALELAEIVTSDTQQYCPSNDNCRYCPHSEFGCEAKQALIACACRDIEAIAGKTGGELTVAALASLYDQSRILKTALANYEKTLKSAVEDAGGRIEFGDGESLELEENETTSYLYRPDIISQFITDGAIDELCPTVSKSKLSDAIGNEAPKGQKGKKIAECLAALEKSGASITKKQRPSLKYKKAS